MINLSQKFGDGWGGRKMRPEFKGRTTMSLVVDGLRTGTSRDLTKSYNQLPIVIGTELRIYGNDESGSMRYRNAIATSSWIPVKDIPFDEWTLIEGWDIDVYNRLVEIGTYYQVRFKLI